MTDQICGLKLEIEGQTLWLNPSGTLYWEEPSMLLVADLHLGRETVLQKSGRPMPQGSTGETLQRLRDQVEMHSPQTLLILGDFIHARSALTPEIVSQIENALNQMAKVHIILVEGNHDRGSRKILAQLPIQMVKPPLLIPPFWMLHDLEEEQKLISTALPENRFSFSGHLHPAVKIPQTGDVIKCFYRRAAGLILPSFGELTGNKKIAPKKGEKVYIITGRSVFELA